MLVEVCLFLVLLATLYLYSKSKYKHFKERGIPFDPPISFLGSLWRTTLRRLNMSEDLLRVYHSTDFEKCRYVGLYQFNKPIVVIKDLDLLKQITVKDFDHFTDHALFFEDNDDPDNLFGKSIFGLKGQKWKEMRTSLSPAFTSSKIKNMCPLISECAQQMTAYLQRLSKETTHVELECKDISSFFMNDVIATIAFGLKVDSFKDNNNQFLCMAKRATTTTGLMMLKFLIAIWMPKVVKVLRWKLSDKTVIDFFRYLVLDTIHYREKENVVRPDMLQLLMAAKKGSLKEDAKSDENDVGFAAVEESNIGKEDSKTVWTDDDLVAQAFLFFFAGFETGSLVVSFVLYELAINPDIQEKLQTEIECFVNENKTEVTYDDLQKMKYLDMVVSETLRKWPPAAQVDRSCVKDYNIGPVNEDDGDVTYTLKKDDLIWIPIMGLHYDLKYWENPEKFDPERFSDENKHKIKPMSYIPFGSGPRNCIASRFALVEMKIMLVHLLSEFMVKPCSRTSIPMKLSPVAFNLKAKNGFWLEFVRRAGSSV